MLIRLKTVSFKAVLLSMTLGLLGVTIALAASGGLDTTFGGDGRVTTDISGGSTDLLTGIAIQADGRIVALGHSNDDFVLTRYNSNGSLDTTFSGDGKHIINFGGIDGTEDVAIQSNGKIVVTGTSCLNEGWPNGACDTALARYNADGSLDTTFSGDGKLKTNFGGGANGTWGGIVIQSNGKIVVAGFMHNGSNFDFVVYRYNSNGTLDTTFSGDGMVRVNFGSGPEDLATDLVIQSDGKIVVGGVSCDVVGLVPWENCDFAVMRLNAGGTLDTTFSGDGKHVVNFGGNVDLPDGIALQSNGKIILAGFKETPTESYFALARLNTNGTLDTTFNGTGKVVTSFGAGSGAHGRDIRMQTDGKIVVVGQAKENFAVARDNTNGGLDTTFSGDGRVMVNFGFNDVGWVIALHPTNGRIIIGGWSDGTQSDFALARLLP